MDLGIQNRVAMVAAASKGLGRAIAEALQAEGARVSGFARSIEAWSEDMLAVQGDITKPEDLQRWFEETVARFGQVDILVTNTGGPPAAPFLQLSEEQWKLGVDSTLMNVVRLCRLVIPDMQQRKWGRILHLTSFVAKQPVELLTVSSTLRAGLSALTKTLADQVAGDGILVNAILPGHFLTDRQKHLGEIRAEQQGITLDEYFARTQATIPLRRYGRADELASVAAFLCSERASYLTGASIQVDGGLYRGTF
ncbi:MAG TPA: SDR family oxidoreductase [Thermoanaerobaculia bacterium]|nr:SDR family oxidoreductase [Thermoanaerobaculia bacterium]